MTTITSDSIFDTRWQNFKLLVDSFGSQKKFCEETGLPTSSVERYYNRKTKIAEAVARKIERLSEKRAFWLDDVIYPELIVREYQEKQARKISGVIAKNIMIVSETLQEAQIDRIKKVLHGQAAQLQQTDILNALFDPLEMAEMASYLFDVLVNSESLGQSTEKRKRQLISYMIDFSESLYEEE